MRRLWQAVVAVVIVAGLSACGDDEPTVYSVPTCPLFLFDTTALDPVVDIVPNTTSVRVGAQFEGEAFLFNPYSKLISFPHVGSVQAVLFHPDTADPAAIFAGALPSPTLGLFLAPGETKSLPMMGGTVACGGPDRLAPGIYDMRLPLTAGLSDPFPITVTE